MFGFVYATDGVKLLQSIRVDSGLFKSESVENKIKTLNFFQIQNGQWEREREKERKYEKVNRPFVRPVTGYGLGPNKTSPSKEWLKNST